MIVPKTILISGASSGLGQALALAYSNKNAVLFLAGRDRLRLSATASACEKLGAKVYTDCFDITDAKLAENWVLTCHDKQAFDLVIANAGISGGNYGQMENTKQSYQIISTNVLGVMYTVIPAISVMQHSSGGQIAIIGSLAGLKGFPGAPAYCASKASIKVWADSLRPTLKKDNIFLSLVCPGFIKTSMTDQNKFPMPLMISAERAAKIIKNGLEKKKPWIIFPKTIYVIIQMLNMLPIAISDHLLARLPKKQGFE
jgi:short-subunit dehydrogenase